MTNDNLSLEQIEGETWGPPPPAAATRLVTVAHDLRRKPVSALNTEDLRVLIAQRIGLGVLIPRALSRLGQDPMLEGDFYPGDLLVAVLGAPAAYWSAHPAELAQVQEVIDSVTHSDPCVAKDIDDFRRRNDQPR